MQEMKQRQDAMNASLNASSASKLINEEESIGRAIAGNTAAQRAFNASASAMTMPKIANPTISPQVVNPTIAPKVATPTVAPKVEMPSYSFGSAGVEKLNSGLTNAGSLIKNNTESQYVFNASLASTSFVTMENGAKKVAQQIEQNNIAQRQFNASLASTNAENISLGLANANVKIRSAEQSAENFGSAANNAGKQGAAGQEEFNSQISRGVSSSGSLLSKLKAVGAAYIGFQGLKSALDASDQLSATTSRINLMDQSFRNAKKEALGTQQTMNMIYQAAQDSRGSFDQMAGVVARFGNNAGDAFSSVKELITFTDIVQKQMTLGGATGQESAAALLQLSQALGSGVLRGDELNSIFEQAPNLIQSIADYMNVPIGQIRTLASKGELSASIVKNAILASADDVNKKFNQMPMTWNQIWTTMSNTALNKLQPVLTKLSEFANQPGIIAFGNLAVDAVSAVGNAASWTLDAVSGLANFVKSNFSVIAPVALTAAAAIGTLKLAALAYNGVMAISNIVTGIATGLQNVWMASVWLSSDATFAATAGQWGLNAALLACPITWIVAGIMLAVGGLYLVVAVINKVTGSSISATGIIGGLIYSLGAIIYNVGAGIYNFLVVDVIQNIVNGVVWAGSNINALVYNTGAFIMNSGKAVGEGVVNTFNTAVYDVETLFMNLEKNAVSSFIPIAKASEVAAESIANAFVWGANKAVSGINWIIDGINKIPGVDLDKVGDLGNVDLDFTSGLYSKIGEIEDDMPDKPEKVSFGRTDYKEYSNVKKAMDLSKAGYKSIGDAYSSGYKAGENLVNSAKKMFSGSDKANKTSDLAKNASKFAKNAQKAAKDGNKHAKKTAKNTDDIKKSLDISNENLKYIRDIADREVINRFTTAEIKVNMTNNNKISKNVDLDGITKHLKTRLEKEMLKTAKGVY